MTLYQHYIIALYSTAITVFCLAGFVAFQNVHKAIKIPYVLYSLCISIWASGQAWALQETRHDISLFAVRNYCHSGVIFIPILFIHFIMVLLRIAKEKKRFIVFCYLIGLIFLALDNFTPLVIRDVALFPPIFNLVYLPGYLHPPLVFLFISLVIYGNVLLLKGYRSASGQKYLQLKWLCWVTILAYIGGAPNFLLGYRIQLKWLMPFGTYILPIYVAGTTYAIIRHQLMDIEIVIKKTLVFAALFTSVFGIVVGITLLIQQFIAGGRAWGFALSALAVVLVVRPLENFLIRMTDKYLFQKKYDYKDLIRRFMEELKTMVLNVRDIAQSTVDFLNASIRPARSAIFMYNKFTNKYELIASINFSGKGLAVTPDMPLINRLAETGKILNLGRDKLLEPQEKNQFAALGVELIIPLMIHKELIGVLCLGKKKSDEEYIEDDIEVLSAFSGALSISLNNALLFDERADAEKRALVGTIATGINHEIGNPLNIITIKLDSFLILAKEGLLKEKSKERILEEVNDIARICRDNAKRIAEITRQVSEFAKPDKQLIFDKVNINDVIDETTVFLEHGMILGREKIIKDIAHRSLYAIADRGQLKQILFNLLKNASCAIDKETGRIVISADNNKLDEIVIKVSDNGCGIAEQDIDKIFIPFFTTKEPGKGTGLGLALVKIMVERNNGKIMVESQKGKGATFTLAFKGGLL